MRYLIPLLALACDPEPAAVMSGEVLIDCAPGGWVTVPMEPDVMISAWTCQTENACRPAGIAMDYPTGALSVDCGQGFGFAVVRWVAVR